MRVISGSARGQKLKSVPGVTTRPTTDRVKENLFNILGSRVIDAVFLDLFAGNGGMGIEALSRGAKLAVFIDKSRACTKMIRTNLEEVGFVDRARVYTNDALKAAAVLGRQGAKFDLIYVDPPYQTGLVAKSLAAISQFSLLAEDGLVIAEYGKKEEIAQFALNLVRVREEKYGDTVLGFYRSKGD
ncbi:MAG: 16S rRNA (guanine(966)-N(2))-methyltransferase RsmD [Candidatus Wallacebacter cryptica]|nr:16S rRNA (guanine(966)-N(2))-methyltransferase RsmD [Bacillota bacterium]